MLPHPFVHSAPVQICHKHQPKLRWERDSEYPSMALGAGTLEDGGRHANWESARLQSFHVSHLQCRGMDTVCERAAYPPTSVNTAPSAQKPGAVPGQANKFYCAVRARCHEVVQVPNSQTYLGQETGLCLEMSADNGTDANLEMRSKPILEGDPAHSHTSGSDA